MKRTDIIVNNVIVAEEVWKSCFLCNLSICKGQCCVGGDIGPEVSFSEQIFIQKNIDRIFKLLPEINQELLKKVGLWEIMSWGGTHLTCFRKGKGSCAYGWFDDNDVFNCVFHHLDNSRIIGKPLSCWLFPIRIYEKNNFIYLKLEKRKYCLYALSDSKNPLLWDYLKTPLIKKFGKKLWFTVRSVIKHNFENIHNEI